ncbi:MAG: oxygenase MpaB family protein [Vicinamibacterales bacterium]
MATLTPTQAVRRINGERVTLLGWSRAILLQLAHPLIAAGVATHSGFRATPWAAAARLRRTVQAMVSLTFADERERSATIARIRAVHDRVHGTLPEAVGPYPAGTPYTAHDPALLAWVHATLLESIVLAYERFVEPGTPALRDAFCDGAAWGAVALGAQASCVPRTWATLQAQLAAVQASGVLAVGAEARAVAAAVLTPHTGIAGVMLAPMATVNRLITRGTLPIGVRAQYCFDWTDADARRLERVSRLVRLARGALPSSAARWRAARRADQRPPTSG